MDGGKAVNVHEGLNRIATALKALGIIWLIGWVASGIYSAFTESDPTSMLLFCGFFGLIGYGAAAALAWIIRGFAQPR